MSRQSPASNRRTEGIMRKLVSLFIVVFGLAWPCAADWRKKAELGAPGQVVVCCLHEGHVYALTTRKGGDPYVMDVLYCLQRGELKPVDKDAPIDELLAPSGRCGGDFHVWGDAFIGLHNKVNTHSTMSAMRLSNFDADPEPPTEESRDYRERWNGLNLYPQRYLAFRHSYDFTDSMAASGTDDARQGFTVDADGKLYTFMAWNGRLYLWTGKFPKVAPKNRLHHSQITWDNWKGKEEETPKPKPAFVIDTDIKPKETFFSYQDRTHYLFVTESGQVHSLPRKGKPEKSELVWNDKRRPVRLLIDDAATGATWAFAPRVDPKKDRDVKDVFFRLADKIEPIEYDPADTSKIDRRKPLDSALSHARFLAKLKKLGKQPAKDGKK
jgi:hypothetical protein